MENNFKTKEISSQKLEKHMSKSHYGPPINYLDGMKFKSESKLKSINVDPNKYTNFKNDPESFSKVKNETSLNSNTSSIRNVMNSQNSQQQDVSQHAMKQPPFHQSTMSEYHKNVFTPRVDQLESTKNKSIPDFLFNISSKIKKGNILHAVLFSILAVSFLILIIIIGVSSVAWGLYIIPSLFMFISLFRVYSEVKTYKKVNKEIIQYKKNQEQGIYTLPRFVEKVNESLHYKQVSQNWISLTIYTCLGLYMGLSLAFAAIIGNWINVIYSGSFEIVMLSSFVILIATAFYHLVVYMSTNNKIEYIYSYYGKNLPSDHAIELTRTKAKKRYKTLFIISILIITLVPILIYIFSQKFRGGIKKVIIR